MISLASLPAGTDRARSCGPHRPCAGRRPGHAATWWRTRRRRRGRRRSARRAASRPSSRRAHVAGSRWGCRTRSCGSSSRRRGAAGSAAASLHANHPVRRRSVCTTTPGTSSAVSGPGWPSMRTYWKPWVVCRGSNGVPEPSDTTRSICPSGIGVCGDEVHRADVVLGDVTARVERFAVGQDRARCPPDRDRRCRTHPLMF